MASHIINDPVHRVMAFNEDEKKLIKSFIDSELFQRLRRIKQLGCGDLIFPGAVHTRFNHCIGASYLAKRLHNQLILDLAPKKKEAEKNVIMIAALLHDVGHGPFSHAFEKLFDKKYENAFQKKELIKKCKISHDKEWLKKFIDEFNYKDVSVTAKDIKAVLLDKKDEYLSDIISSQLDVDRMDYLLRDSHFCGVPYGKIDLKWLMSCITTIPVDEKIRLGISKKGIGALEHYITARRLMTRNIYYHGKKNAAEYYIREFLSGLIENHPSEIKGSMLDNFLQEYSKYSDKIISISGDDKQKEEKGKFINKAFQYYKNITDDDVWFYIKNLANKAKDQKSFVIASRLMKRELPDYYQLNPSRIAKATMIVSEEIDNLKKNDRWMIHLDTLDFVSYKRDKEPIYVKEGESGCDIYHESTILNLLSDRNEETHYLYLDKYLNEKKRNRLLSALKDGYCLYSPEV